MELPKKHTASSAHKEIVLEQHLVSQLVLGQGYVERSCLAGVEISALKVMPFDGRSLDGMLPSQENSSCLPRHL